MDGKIGNDEVGTVKAWSLQEVPYGWMECNGQEISRDEYNDLFEKFRTQHVSNTSTITLLTRYGTGNGNTTFNVPDYQETALVGLGRNVKNAGTIGDDYHDTYTLGQFKNDQLQNHTHTYEAVKEHLKDYDSGSQRTGITNNTTYATSGVDSGFRYGNVTRGKRIGVKYIIKVL